MVAGTQLSSGWSPSNLDREYGHAVLHLSDEQIDALAEDMRLWAGANANRAVARKSNWSMAFKGWMRREAKKIKPNGHSLNGKNGSRSFFSLAMGDSDGE